MPIYSYKCSATGEEFDRFERMTDTGKSVTCQCGANAPKVYHAPMAFVESDCPPHIAPKTGEKITTNRQRREYMARENMVDANDFKPDFVIREQKARRERLRREAAKAYNNLPQGMTPETVIKEVL
jgi:putative FmdB family regulatory protein